MDTLLDKDAAGIYTGFVGGESVENRCLEAIRAIGKALGQMALYTAGHPAAVATLQSARENLAAAVALTADGELVVGLDEERFIANGRVIAAAADLPNAVVQLYRRFKLASVTFRSGVTQEELAAFCELAALRPDAPAAADPRGFLAGKGVSRLLLNETVYTKAGEPGAGPGGGGGGGAAVAEDQIPGINAAIQAHSLERTMMALVEKSVPDPAQRENVISQVMKLLESDIAQRVDEVTLPLKREKKAVENEAARTDDVLQNSVEGVVVVDEQGKILMMNPAAEQIYGAPLAKLAGTTVGEKAGDQFVVTMSAELSTPADREIAHDVKTQGADGTRKTLRASSAVVRTQEGKVVGMVTALPDVIKHRELEAMQRDFVAHVTHELRAPLASISAALETIQNRCSSAMGTEETQVLATAMRNSGRLAEMINGILDFAKIEAGQMAVHPRPVDPRVLAQEAVESLQSWARKKGLSLSWAAPEGLPLASADPPRVVQILVNLLSNAIKFSPPGGKIEVKISRRTERSGAFVEFAVSDMGPGIAKKDRERIFEKFAQVSAGETRVSGTGLGLSIARSLVLLHDGRLWLESEPGRGSTFFFVLPVPADQPAEAFVTRARPASHEARPWWKRMLGLR